MFGYNLGSIRRLIIKDAAITGRENAGIIAAKNGIDGGESENTTHIEECKIINGSVKGERNIGGIAGENNSSIDACSNNAYVSASIYSGGIAGNNAGDIGNCVNYGYIEGKESFTGGIAGMNTYGSSIKKCSNEGNISGETSCGGIAGESNESLVCCYNTGSISGYESIGGIVGHLGDTSIEDCYNTGSIRGYEYAGGITGGSSNGSITRCYNAGTLNGSLNSGAVSGSNDIMVNSCYYNADICCDSNQEITGISTKDMVSGDVLTGAMSGLGVENWRKRENDTFDYYPEIALFYDENDMSRDSVRVNRIKKVVVVVNKNWETDGVMSALVNNAIRPEQLPFPEKLYYPKYSEKTCEPRAVFMFDENGEASLQVVVRCIQDSMYYDVAPDPSTQSGSSSEEKYRVLPSILKEDNPDLVISVSTAGYPADFSCNGSVVIGGNFFLHDGHPGNPKSDLKHPHTGKLLSCNANKKLFGLINAQFKNSTEPKFLKTPNNPSERPCCTASDVFTALSVVNVTEYEEYNWADHEALAHYKETEKRLPCNSSETTHGVVRLCSNSPIIFVSPITDQFGHFDFEVTATQNYAASFNAGIVVGHLLCAINDYVKKGGVFFR